MILGRCGVEFCLGFEALCWCAEVSVLPIEVFLILIVLVFELSASNEALGME